MEVIADSNQRLLALMMAHAEITHDLYRWLVQNQVLPNTQKYKPSGNFELEIRLQQQLQSGFLVAKLLTLLAAEKAVQLNAPLVSSVKDSNTPAARVYNWNIICEGFVKLGIVLPKEQQKQITAGNFNSLVLFLLDVQNKSSHKKLQKSSSSPPPQPALDIKRIHKYEQCQQCETVLEMIIVLIAQNMGLAPKQAVATLAESSKYLSHMMVKGIKGSFDQIIDFLRDSKSKMDKIVYLVEKDPSKNMQFLLQVFKPTLISREPEVCKAGCELFKSLIYESSKFNSKNLLYQVLCKEGEGFDFLYMGLKRHPYLNFEIFEAMYVLLLGVLKDFFEVQLRRVITNEQEYLKAIVLLIEPALANANAKDEVFKNGIFASWQKSFDDVGASKLKGKDLNMAHEEIRYQYLELMYLLWLGYYKDLEAAHAEQLLIKITQELKKNMRSEVYTIRIPSLLKLFSILQFLASNKNKLAALLYKKIIFLFVENHSQEEMRQIVLQNLTLTIRKFPTIPLQFLLEPMLKQLTNKEGTSYILNMYDFQFVIELCKHPKMEEYYAITFLDYFIKLYTKSVIYSSLIFRTIEAITARFCQSEQIREYCLKFTESSLNNYGMLVMGKAKANRGNYQGQKGQNKEEAIINNQKKSLIVQLIKHFISLEHRELTEEIKERVSALFVDWYENRNYYDKGLAAILMEIGDIEDILVEYKQKKISSGRAESKEQAQKYQSSNEFQSRGENTGRQSNKESKGLLKYQDLYEDDRGSPNLVDVGLGYKKKKIDLLNKYELGSRSKHIKPDPKVLEDIEKIKQKWKMDQSRAKQEQEEAKKDRMGKINEVQLFQRNLSLGYSKLPQLSTNQVLFEIDSVKKKHLKDSLDFVNLELEEDRQSKSFQNVIQRYKKYIKSLFINYASKSAPMSEDRELNILSFTEIMRMLKDKNLIAKIPKIAINQIITTINQKRKKERNILGGVYEQDFPTFILYFTDLLVLQDTLNKKDEPFGLKVEKVILKLLENEKFAKDLFDPKIQALKEELEFNQQHPVPADYKKTKEVQVDLDYTIQNQNFNIDQSFIDCYQIVDGLVYEATGVHIVSPFTDFKQKVTLIRIFKPVQAKAQSQSTDNKNDRAGTEEAENSQSLVVKKDILTESHNSFTKPLKKLSKNLIKLKSQSQRNVASELQSQSDKVQKDKKREAHALKLKQQIIRMREEKQKLQREKKEKQKQQEEKLKKKEDLKKQYLEENKRKIKEKKEEDERKIKQQQMAEQENKQKRKAEIKAKEGQLLQKEKKIIEAKKQRMVERAKQQQLKQKKLERFVKSKSNDKLLSDMKASAVDQKMKDLLIKNSMENGEVKRLIDKNKKRFEELFEIYWNWEKQKMEMKNLAQLLKDLETIKYVSPKDISDVYKSVAKGQLLGVQQFIECVVRLSYRSQAIEQETREKHEIAKEDQGQNKVKVAPFQFMLNLLRMNEPGYKQLIIQIKQEKEAK